MSYVVLSLELRCLLVAGGTLKFIHVESILKQRLSPRSQKLQEKFGINLIQLSRVPPPGVGNSNSVVNGPSKKMQPSVLYNSSTPFLDSSTLTRAPLPSPIVRTVGTLVHRYKYPEVHF